MNQQYIDTLNELLKGEHMAMQVYENQRDSRGQSSKRNA